MDPSSLPLPTIPLAGKEYLLWQARPKRASTSKPATTAPPAHTHTRTGEGAIICTVLCTSKVGAVLSWSSTVAVFSNNIIYP
jgi:hypothetical protein